ncbi:MAG: Rho termination factor N-terminal domain-containing protein, partial [Bacteroidota bacterium]
RFHSKDYPILMYTIDSLNEKLLPELKDLAKKLKVSGIDGLKKQEIIYKIIDYLAANPDTVLPEEPSKKAAEPAKQEEQPRPKKAARLLMTEVDLKEEESLLQSPTITPVQFKHNFL